MGVHCVVQMINLVVWSLYNLIVIAHIEAFMVNLYNYFSHSWNDIWVPKKFIIMEIKGNNIIKNVKTRWMSMLEPLKQILVKYRPLLGFMQANFSFIQTTKVCNSKLFFFCFPNSLLVYVVSWYIGFLVILIKPKTLGVDIRAIEMGIIIF
jgi:hypothetical protein